MPPVRSRINKLSTPITRYASLWQKNVFSALNYSAAVTVATWNEVAKHPKLWLYHLHYFDECHESLILRWIEENPPLRGIGWDPYPLSLRIVNWIKWIIRTNNHDSTIISSLWLQTVVLEQTLEYHLYGNHLLANAKALFFAGSFFQDTKANTWVRLANDIFANQIPEQILADGAHFELSPMYHLIVLEDLLDLINLARVYNTKLTPEIFPAAERMLGWLEKMIHPDQQIAFFNDSCFQQSATPQQIYAYASTLGITKTGSSLATSGYFRLEQKDAVVIADCAAVGPTYLPGHAHADTLSFELSVGGERIFVNSGISTYAPGPKRDAERATKAHNTVEINDENSSEVWASFRVARRAKVHDVVFKRTREHQQLSAWHDGYYRLKARAHHKRTWQLDQQLLIRDEINSVFPCEVKWYYHLHPAVQVEQQTEQQLEITTNTGRKIIFSIASKAIITLVDSQFYPAFGQAVNNKTIMIALTCNKEWILETTVRY